MVKYKITGWHRHNTVLDYNCPCQKETGFFFLPVTTATELVSAGKCSEMDILLDLWISAVYRDEQVQGSFDGPVVYLRNGTGNPLVSYSELGRRWGMSKATVGRVLRKLEKLGYISLLTFPGRHGTAIYLCSYLSTMFQVSDVMVDKDEVAMSLNIRVDLPEEVTENEVETSPEAAESGSNGEIIVSKPQTGTIPHLNIIASKVLNVLQFQGIPCTECPRCSCKLYTLSDDCKGVGGWDAVGRRFRIEVLCSTGTPMYTFELSVRPVDGEGGICNGKEKG